MSRPHLRVADVLKRYWPEYGRRHPVESHARKVMEHLRDCRSAALGGHLHRCDRCGGEVPVYNSCQDRHCPTCQTLRKQQWVEHRQAELLPVPYFHVVFTLPHRLNPLVRANPRRLLRELFGAVGWVLQRFAADPQWKLQGRLGFVAVLHTWTQRLTLHYHVHCLVPGGAWDEAAGAWRGAHRCYLFGQKALAKAFQARYIARLKALRRRNRLFYDGLASEFEPEAGWKALLDDLWAVPWIVYPKATVSTTEHTLDYLSRYTHRVAISDHRLRALENGSVTFDWRDRADGNTVKQLTLPVEDFISRFLLHILPHGFSKVRSFGWLGGPKKAAVLAAIRQVLKAKTPPPPPEQETTQERILRLTGVDIKRCPHCGDGRLVPAGKLPPARAGP